MSSHPVKRDVNIKLMELREKRIKANAEIIRRITEYLNNNPEIRFNQALQALNIVSFGDEPTGNYQTKEFYIEPEEVLKRMR